MTEPVAYVQIKDGKAYSVLRKGTPNGDYVPVYTAEQLHPRVKMTRAEFDEWKEVFDDYEFFSDAFSQGVTVERYTKLFKKLYSTKHDDLSSLEIEVKFATLWANYNPENPEETIEIVPDMKWFVISKKQYQPDMDQGISESGYLYLTQGDIYSVEYHEMTTFKDEATQFNTEDEAKLWTTPDTEAVQLPVEGE